MPQKTRAQMIAIIERGESVMLNGRIISRIQDLPDPVEIAKRNPEQQAALLAQAMRERAEADRVVAALLAAAQAGATPAEAVAEAQVVDDAQNEAAAIGETGETPLSDPVAPPVPPGTTGLQIEVTDEEAAGKAKKNK